VPAARHPVKKRSNPEEAARPRRCRKKRENKAANTAKRFVMACDWGSDEDEQSKGREVVRINACGGTPLFSGWKRTNRRSRPSRLGEVRRYAQRYELFDMRK